MQHPHCPRCGHPTNHIEKVGPPGMTGVRCPKGCGVWQKPVWR